jgi:hypothetical protein
LIDHDSPDKRDRGTPCWTTARSTNLKETGCGIHERRFRNFCPKIGHYTAERFFFLLIEFAYFSRSAAPFAVIALAVAIAITVTRTATAATAASTSIALFSAARAIPITT